MAKAKKSQVLIVLQNAVDEAIVTSGNPYLRFEVPYAVFQNFFRLVWDRATTTDVKTGLLGNPFLFGEQDAEAVAERNALAVSLEIAGHEPTGTDAAAIRRLDINPPVGAEMLSLSQRLGLLAEVLLPANHPFCAHLAAHNEQLQHFVSGVWRTTVLCHHGAMTIRGALYVQKMALVFSAY